MAKKKAAEKDERDKIIKISLTEAEQRTIRMAAASNNKSMVEFARDATLTAAK